MKKLILISLIFGILTSCGAQKNMTRVSNYPKIYEEKPVTLLIMPAVNNTSVEEATVLLYTSISKPLAEAGYYVISPLIMTDYLKADSSNNAESFINTPLTTLQQSFGADAVVYSEIKSWEKIGMGIQTDIRYFIKSTHTGEIIFDRICNLFLDLYINTWGISTFSFMVDMMASAINTALTDHIVAARKANYYIFQDIPRGVCLSGDIGCCVYASPTRVVYG